MRGRPQSGQVIVLVAFALLALIGTAALLLLAGSVEWQRNQLQQLADQAALDSAMKIGVGCSVGSATTVITEADNFIATQRSRTGTLNVAAGTCATPYTGTDTFAGGLSETIHYPYRAHQQQVEVILTLTLPISFGSELGKTNTSVVRRAVAQQLAGSVPAISAQTLTCAAGQVNVSGSVVAQNLIALTGSCALYAHDRFDAASATYSDLGNVSVYTAGQTWGAGTPCTPGSFTGFSSVICADGYELTGHITPTCAGSTDFLSTGDRAVNPNPCAAGTAPQPVAPVSVLLPPEPDTDAAAIGTLKGNGGAPCTPSTTNSNIVVNGVTVGTAHTPASALPSTTPDASGFYHFKPSCYGYLNPGLLGGGGGGITRVQTGLKQGPSDTTVRATLPFASTAGNLLVVTIRSEPTDTRSSAPSGWIFANGVNNSGAERTEIWYYPNAPSLSSATFTVGGFGTAVAQMTEWSGVAATSPLDQTGTRAQDSTSSATISTIGAMAVSNELVITSDGYQADNGQTFSRPSGWSNLQNDPTDGFSSEYRLNLAAGAVASETVSYSTQTSWALVIATFKPAGGGSGAKAVLDPGFYYFNGDGAGGGGICLNGGTLLAKDVTLEFVGTAGFSSGTCAAGGGTNCTAPCKFGSDPANAAVDNLTWFASPCEIVPNVPDPTDPSCTASAWCPVGDRACDNLLIWAAPSPTGTGQIAVKGSAADAWLIGSIYWPSTGTCSYTSNGTSTIAGTFSCGNLSFSASGGGTDVGGDYGISTALVEAILVE